MPLTAAAISHKLREHANPENVAILQRFFKTGPGQYGEGDRFIGVKVPSIRAVCRECRGATLGEIRKLLRSPIHEERALALLMLVDAFKAVMNRAKRRIYELYLANTRLHQQLGSRRLFRGADRRRLAAGTQSRSADETGEIDRRSGSGGSR